MEIVVALRVLKELKKAGIEIKRDTGITNYGCLDKEFFSTFTRWFKKPKKYNTFFGKNVSRKYYKYVIHVARKCDNPISILLHEAGHLLNEDKSMSLQEIESYTLINARIDGLTEERCANRNAIAFIKRFSKNYKPAVKNYIELMEPYYRGHKLFFTFPVYHEDFDGKNIMHRNLLKVEAIALSSVKSVLRHFYKERSRLHAREIIELRKGFLEK